MLLRSRPVSHSIPPILLLAGSLLLALAYLLVRDWYDRRVAAGLVARVRAAAAQRPAAPPVAPRVPPATIALSALPAPLQVAAPGETTRRLARGTRRPIEDDPLETEPTRVLPVRARPSRQTVRSVEALDDEYTWIDPFPPSHG